MEIYYNINLMIALVSYQDKYWISSIGEDPSVNEDAVFGKFRHNVIYRIDKDIYLNLLTAKRWVGKKIEIVSYE